MIDGTDKNPDRGRRHVDDGTSCRADGNLTGFCSMHVRAGSSRSGRLVRCLFAPLIAVVLLTSCSILPSGGDEGDASDKPSPSATRDKGAAPGALQTEWMLVRSWVRVDLLALDRTSKGVVTARFRLSNTGDEEFNVSSNLGQTSYGTNKWSTSAVTLVDPQAFKRHYVYHSTDGECACSVWEDSLYVEPRESVEVFSSFPAPKTKVVDLVVPNTPPFLAVPIGDRPGPVKPGRGQLPRDPSKMDLDDPKILPLRSDSEALDGSKEEEEKGKKVEVRLSSDVLFEINKAELSPKAEDVLETLAEDIDESSDPEIQVDGYTDDTGNDAINDPLSRRRAQAVRDKLTELVTRDGVTYTVAGHGSADPVAANNSDENRKRNRRVSVTFEKK